MRRVNLCIAICVMSACLFSMAAYSKDALVTTQSPPNLKGWERENSDSAWKYIPTVGPLAPAKKQGYLDFALFSPHHLKGRSLSKYLDTFMSNQEKSFSFLDWGQHEPARADGPDRAWGYMRGKNKSGTYLNFMYMAFRIGDDSARVVREAVTDNYQHRTKYKTALLALYAHIAAQTPIDYRPKDKHVSAYTTMYASLHHLRTESRDERSARRNAAHDAKKKQRLAQENRHLASIVTKPGKGLKQSDILAIYYDLTIEITAFGGKGRNQIWLLLKDGTAYQNPKVPPADLNVAASRKAEPEKWHQWKRSGKTYQIRQGSNDWQTLEGSAVLPGRKRTLTFKGKNISSWSVMGVGGGASTHQMTLTRDGLFEASSFSFSGGSAFILPNAAASRLEDKSGEQTSFSGEGMPALINSTKRTNRNGSDKTGDYAIKDHTIEFLTDSGKLSRKLFFVFADGDFWIGDKTYSRPD